jgi:hypothetical protein
VRFGVVRREGVDDLAMEVEAEKLELHEVV